MAVLARVARDVRRHAEALPPESGVRAHLLRAATAYGLGADQSYRPSEVGVVSSRDVVVEVADLFRVRLPLVPAGDPGLPALRGASALISDSLGRPLEVIR